MTKTLKNVWIQFICAKIINDEILIVGFIFPKYFDGKKAKTEYLFKILLQSVVFTQCTIDSVEAVSTANGLEPRNIQLKSPLPF